MLKVNVRHVNLFLKLMHKAADNGEFKRAARYWLLAVHELNRQRHISIAHKIYDHKMQPLMFKIEIDENFKTAQGVNN